MTRLWNIINWIGYIHEIFHYIPSQVFGLHPTMNHRKVVTDWENVPKYQKIIVVILPFLIFLNVFLFLLIKWFYIWPTATWKDHFSMALWSAISLLWIFSCVNDIREIYEILTDKPFNPPNLRNNHMNDLLTTSQAAEYLSVSLRRVQARINAGSLKAVKMGRDWFISENDLKLFADDNHPTGRPKNNVVSVGRGRFEIRLPENIISSPDLLTMLSGHRIKPVIDSTGNIISIQGQRNVLIDCIKTGSIVPNGKIQEIVNILSEC